MPKQQRMHRSRSVLGGAPGFVFGSAQERSAFFSRSSLTSQGAQHAEADFGITPRTTFKDADQSPTPAPLQGHGPPAMKAPYPGITITKTGLRLEQGGLGFTQHLFPEYQQRIVRSGPNTRLVFVESFRWANPIPSGASGPIPDGIYLSAALFPGDPFYEKQTGGGDFCGKKDMDTLRGDIYSHELHHQAQEIDLRHELKLHEVYEPMVVFFAPGASADAVNKVFAQPADTYGQRIEANDVSIDQTNPATTSINCDMRGL